MDSTLPEVPVYQQRVIAEAGDLRTKIEALKRFLSSTTFAALDDVEKDLLEKQATHMEAYEEILTARIVRFDEIREAERVKAEEIREAARKERLERANREAADAEAKEQHRLAENAKLEPPADV